MDNYVEDLREWLMSSVKKLCTSKEIEMAFSGGLDSCVLAKILVDLEYSVTGYVAGVKGSTDIIQAKKAALEIGLNLKVIELSEKDIKDAIGIQGKIIKKVYDSIDLVGKEQNDNLTPNAIPISFNLPLYFVAKNAKNSEIIVSQGPDEMLGGYTRHYQMNEEDAILEMKNNTEDFLKYGIKQNLETARYWKKDFVMPYLDSEVVEFCLNLPYKLRTRKEILRKLAVELGISKELAYNKKKAAQYGSGIIDVMKKLAKKEGNHISWLVKEKIAEVD